MVDDGQFTDPVIRITLLVFGGISYFCLSFIWFSLPAYLSPIIEELALTSTEAGILAGAVPLTYIPLALITGVVIDRIGPRIGIGLATAIFAIAQIFRGVSPDFMTMLIFTLMIGVGATGITFSLPKLVAELFPEDWVGTASSVYLVGAAGGSATVFGLGRPVLGPLLGGWRELFFASGAVALGFTLMWTVISLYSYQRGIIGHTAASGEQRRFSLQSVREDVHAVITHREMVLLVIVGTMYLFLSHGLKGWLVTIFEVQGIPATVGGPITSILIIAQIFGVLTIPFLADRFIGKRPAVVGSGLLCIVGPLVLFSLGTELSFAVVAVIVVGIGIGGLSPLIRAIPVQLEGIGPRLTATAVGLIFAIGEIGGFAGPVLVGVLHDFTGSFGGGILLFSCCGFAVVVAGLMMDL